MNLDAKILSDEVKNLIRMADGDGRKLLIILESILRNTETLKIRFLGKKLCNQ